MNYEILDNAFWETGDKNELKCIKLYPIPEGGRRKEVHHYKKYLEDKSLCPHFKEVVAHVGAEKIDANTAERHKKKEREERERRAAHDAQRRSQELEVLFNMKLQTFEIDEIKESTNRKLRQKIRRAKNPIELNALASIMLALELGYIKDESTTE